MNLESLLSGADNTAAALTVSSGLKSDILFGWRYGARSVRLIGILS